MLVAVRTRMGEHPTVLRHAERDAPLDRAQEQRAAAWSTSLLEFLYLGYGSPIMRLDGPGVRISTADFASWIHAYGLAAATAEAGPEIADPDLVLVDTLTGRRAQRGLEHGIELHGHDEPAGQLVL